MVKKVSNRKELIVMGEFNARDRKRVHSNYKGNRLIDMCESTFLKILNGHYNKNLYL